jgi:hypothetical protein
MIKDPDKMKRAKKVCILRGDYGLSFEEFEQVKQFQENKCAICGRPLDRPNVDHNHKTGESRGLICWHCNNALGKFRDDPVILRAAADYLLNPPIPRALGGRRFGLPGRITTSKKRRRMLAKKAVCEGLVPVGAYDFCAPTLAGEIMKQRGFWLEKEIDLRSEDL